MNRFGVECRIILGKVIHMKSMHIKQKKMLKQLAVGAVLVGAGFYLHILITPQAGGFAMGSGDVSVSVQSLKREDLTDKQKFIASVEAINSVDIIPQVSGYLEEVRFKDGAFVQEGDVLFVIEQNKFRANVESAEADLEKAKSDLVQVSSDYRRQAQLYKEKITPKAALEVAENKLNQAKSSVKQAEANLALAKINLSYAEIKAPISGYIGKVLVSKGNYVSPATASLARIVQTDPIRVAFSVSDKERLAFLKDIHGNTDQVRIDIVYPDGRTDEIKPENIFAGNEINPETATLPVYVDYKNPDNILIPGNYVDILVGPAERVDSLTVPTVALGQDINGTYVMTVDEDNVVHQKYVELGRISGNAQEVLSGLTDTDKVIVQGLQKVQNGIKVVPILVK